MRFLFLDIDGVLNNDAYWEWADANYTGRNSLMERHEHMIDPAATEMLAEIVEELDLTVIISSTWRKLHTLEEINAMLRYRGFTRDAVDVTPVTVRGFRGDEVARWISNSEHVADNNYIILDDDGDFYIDQPHLHINGKIGLTKDNIEEIRNFFKNGKFDNE